MHRKLPLTLTLLLLDQEMRRLSYPATRKRRSERGARLVRAPSRACVSVEPGGRFEDRNLPRGWGSGSDGWRGTGGRPSRGTFRGVPSVPASTGVGAAGPVALWSICQGAHATRPGGPDPPRVAGSRAGSMRRQDVSSGTPATVFTSVAPGASLLITGGLAPPPGLVAGSNSSPRYCRLGGQGTSPRSIEAIFPLGTGSQRHAVARPLRDDEATVLVARHLDEQVRRHPVDELGQEAVVDGS